MPFEIKYAHETLIKEQSINEADLPEQIRDAIESFNAVKATVPKQSNQDRKELTKELKSQSSEIAELIKEWKDNPAAFDEPAPAPAPNADGQPGSSVLGGEPSPSLENGGTAQPGQQPAAAPLPAPAPKKKSGSFLKVALWGLFGILAIAVGPEMVNNTKEWLKQRKK